MKVKKDYNKELVKRGELLIDPSLFQEERQTTPLSQKPHPLSDVPQVCFATTI